MKDFKLTDLEKVGPTTETKLNKAGIFSKFINVKDNDFMFLLFS